MYSITQSPGFAIDLAHAVMDENLPPRRFHPPQPGADQPPVRGCVPRPSLWDRPARRRGSRPPARGVDRSPRPRSGSRGELGQDPRDVDRDRLRRHEQLGSDLAVAASLRHQTEHFGLARREGTRPGGDGSRPHRQPSPPGHPDHHVSQWLSPQSHADLVASASASVAALASPSPRAASPRYRRQVATSRLTALAPARHRRHPVRSRVPTAAAGCVRLRLGPPGRAARRRASEGLSDGQHPVDHAPRTRRPAVESCWSARRDSARRR